MKMQDRKMTDSK